MASSLKEQAQALYDHLKDEMPDIDENIAVAIYEWAKRAAVALEAVDTEESKKAMLMCAVMFAGLNGHEYGNPNANPGLKACLEDLKNCIRQQYLDALTYEDCNMILRTAMERRVP